MRKVTFIAGEPDGNDSAEQMHEAARREIRGQAAEYVEGGKLPDMIREDLVAGRIAIDSYREMIASLGDKDTTTKRMLAGILAMDEEHADDLVGLLEERDA